MEGWNSQFPKKHQKQAYFPSNQKNGQEKDLPNDLEEHIMIRSKQGISIYSLKSDQSTLITQDNNQAIFNKDGSQLLCVGTSTISLYDLNRKDIISFCRFDQIVIASMSSLGKYCTLIEKKSKDLYILHILALPNFTNILTYDYPYFRKETWPLIKFSPTETQFYHITPQHVLHVYPCVPNPMPYFTHILPHQVDHFDISPDPKTPYIALSLMEHQIGFNTSQAFLTMYKIGSNSLTQILSESMKKANEIKTYWSPDGSACLIQTSTLHDDTGNSYYGQHCLQYFQIESKTLRKVNCPPGPIHDVQWSGNCDTFIVISGFMPASAVMYRKDCTPFFEFGKQHKNTVRYGPYSRMVMLGGFGNLSGDIEVWDLTEMKVIGSWKCASAMSYDWSQDGRQFMCGILFPRLRVENNFQVFYYSGFKIISKDFSDSELYEVKWRPSIGQFKDKPASRENSVQKQSMEESQKPRKVLNLQFSSFAKEMIKEEKKQSQGRYLNPHENFEQSTNEDKNIPTEVQISEEQQTEKKKRVRHKKIRNNDSIDPQVI